jgi:hypothetical protein
VGDHDSFDPTLDQTKVKDGAPGCLALFQFPVRCPLAVSLSP